MIGKRALLAAVLGIAALHTHASKFPGPDPYVLIGAYALQFFGFVLATVVFAIRLRRVCHPNRSRVRQTLLGAAVGAATFYLALSAAFSVWILVAMLDLITLAHIAAALVFPAMIYVGYRLASWYAASAPEVER